MEDEQDKVAQILAYGYCDCASKGIAQAPHTCPYAEDINNDSESLCNCCAECEHQCHQCAMDI
jgi:hypothetical protein